MVYLTRNKVRYDGYVVSVLNTCRLISGQVHSGFEYFSSGVMHNCAIEFGSNKDIPQLAFFCKAWCGWGSLSLAIEAQDSASFR